MRPVGMIGQTRLAICAERLPGCVVRWREQWCFVEAGDGFEVTCMAQAEAQGMAQWQASQTWLSARLPGGNLHLAGDWQGMVFGPHAAQIPDDATGRHLLEQAQRALVDALLAELGLPPCGALTCAGAGGHDGLLSSRLLLQITRNTQPLWVLLDASLLDHFLPRPAVRRALSDRQGAVGGARFKLRVQMPLSELSIGDLQGLAPGDVLKARTLLIDPLQLVAGEQVIAEGYLARQDNRLALQLITSDTGI